MNFTDNADQRIGYLTYDLASGETSDPIVVKVIAASDVFLRSSSTSVAKLKAREHLTADPYVDLASGIDLGTYTPGSVSFDLICEAQSVSGRQRAGMFLGRTTSGAANWGL